MNDLNKNSSTVNILYNKLCRMSSDNSNRVVFENICSKISLMFRIPLTCFIVNNINETYE